MSEFSNTLIYQNDPRLPDVFRKEGCGARTLMAMAEFTEMTALTNLQIELCIHTAQQIHSVLATDCSTGTDEHKITEYAFKLLGETTIYYRQIGIKKGNEFFDWSGNAIDPKSIAFTKLHWITDFSSGHFTLGDSNGEEIFDPWSTAVGCNPWDASGKTGYTINKHRVDACYAYKMFRIGA